MWDVIANQSENFSFFVTPLLSLVSSYSHTYPSYKYCPTYNSTKKEPCCGKHQHPQGCAKTVSYFFLFFHFVALLAQLTEMTPPTLISFLGKRKKRH